MDMRRVGGRVLIVVGVVSVAFGVWSFATADDAEVAAAPSASPSASQAASPSPSEARPSASEAESSAPTETTRPSPSETTDSPAPRGGLQAAAVTFVDDFGVAIANADVDWLFDRIHSVVLIDSDPETCRSFIEEQILALEDYRLNGDPGTESQKTIDTSEGPVVVDDHMDVPVAFTYQGQAFEVAAGVAPEDDEIHWLTTCQ